MTLWTVVCQSSLSVGFTRQEYWSVLAITGLHTLLEHHISCCPSCQLSCVPDAVRTPAIQAAAPPPYLALTGANPSLPGQPQEQTPVGNPHAEVEIKPQLKPRGRVVEEEGPKPSHQPYKLKVKSNQLGRFCVCGISKQSLRAPTKENALVLIAVVIGGKNTH